jgi:hypothetical protein
MSVLDIIPLVLAAFLLGFVLGAALTLMMLP